MARPSPVTAPPDVAMVLLAFDARMRAMTAGTTGQMTNDAIDRTRAAMALPSVRG